MEPDLDDKITPEVVDFARFWADKFDELARGHCDKTEGGRGAKVGFELCASYLRVSAGLPDK